MKCNGQNQTLSFTFSHCKYFCQQKTKLCFHLQVYNSITYTPESKIRTRHRERKKERERGKEREREEGLKKEERKREKKERKKEEKRK